MVQRGGSRRRHLPHPTSSASQARIPARRSAGRSLDQGERRARAIQRFRKLAWELEIQGIERIEGPLKDPNLSPVIHVTIARPPRRSRAGPAPTGNHSMVILDDEEDDSNASQSVAKSAFTTDRPRKGTTSTGDKVVVIIDSDDDNDDAGESHAPRAETGRSSTTNSSAKRTTIPDPSGPPLWATDPPGFYLTGSVPKERADCLLRYQQRSISAGKYPSPQAGLRFDLAGLQRALERGQGAAGAAAAAPPPPPPTSLQDRENQVSEEYQRQTFGDGAPLTFDKAVTTHWLSEPGTLYKAFPMVENTVFFCAGNYEGLQSNCFFKAVAYQVYGARTFDARVKAEHLQCFSDVLWRPEHPRHDMYTRLNEWFYESYVSQAQGQGGGGSGSGGGRRIELAANFYQLLTIPNCYMPMDMFEVTADLYNLFIVIYTLNTDNIVTEMTTKGSYNARHIFILFYAGNHFQPMVPNDYYASEFQLPRITHYSTLNYPLTRARDKDAHTVDHVYRRRCRVTVDRKPGPPPVDVVFYEKTIDAVVNGRELL